MCDCGDEALPCLLLPGSWCSEELCGWPKIVIVVDDVVVARLLVVDLVLVVVGNSVIKEGLFDEVVEVVVVVVLKEEVEEWIVVVVAVVLWDVCMATVVDVIFDSVTRLFIEFDTKDSIIFDSLLLRSISTT